MSISPVTAALEAPAASHPTGAPEETLLERAWQARYADPDAMMAILDAVPGSPVRDVLTTFLAWRAQKLDQVLEESRRLGGHPMLPDRWRARILAVQASTLNELGLTQKALEVRKRVDVLARAAGDRVLQIMNTQDMALLFENVERQMAFDQSVATLRAIRDLDDLLPAERHQLGALCALTVVNLRGLDAYDEFDIPDDVPSLEEAREIARVSWPELGGVLTGFLVELALDEGDLDRAADLARELPVPAEMRDVVNGVLVSRALARLYRSQGRFEQAAELLEAECERLPPRNRHEALIPLVDVYEEAGDLTSALAASKRLVEALHDLHESESGTALRAMEVHFRTERAEAEAARAREESERDALTDVWNRRHLVRVGRPALDVLGSSLAVIDIDWFKQINDQLGHSMGDVVLQHVARALQAASREGDVVARLGGDEFVVLRQAHVDGDLAADLAMLTSGVVVTPCEGDTDMVVSLSIGIVPSEGRGWEDAFDRADESMYEAKRSRRGMPLRA